MIALVALRAICSYERSAHFKFHLNGRFAHRNAFLCLFRKKIKKLHPQRDEDCLVLPPYFTLSSLKTPQCERVTRMLTGANRQKPTSDLQLRSSGAMFSFSSVPVPTCFRLSLTSLKLTLPIIAFPKSCYAVL